MNTFVYCVAFLVALLILYGVYCRTLKRIKIDYLYQPRERTSIMFHLIALSLIGFIIGLLFYGGFLDGLNFTLKIKQVLLG